MKYKQLKPITFAAVLEAGDTTCLEFVKEFSKFLNWGIVKFESTFNFSDSIYLSHITETFKNHPLWEKFFIDKGFIEIEEERILYKKGDIFIRSDRSKWIIITFGTHQASLVCVGPSDHMHFAKSYSGQLHTVTNSDHITVDEMNKICSSLKSYFTKEMD